MQERLGVMLWGSQNPASYERVGYIDPHLCEAIGFDYSASGTPIALIYYATASKGIMRPTRISMSRHSVHYKDADSSAYRDIIVPDFEAFNRVGVIKPEATSIASGTTNCWHAWYEVQVWNVHQLERLFDLNGYEPL